MSIEPFIGTKISLISKVGIRYEGSLHSLNTDDSTIVLKDVRSMGTEGRSTTTEVPPSTKVHDFVVFRGEDVTDILVNETQISNDDNKFDDPAIFKTYKEDEFLVHGSKPIFETKKENKSFLKEVGIAMNSEDKYKNNETYKSLVNDMNDVPNDFDKELETFQFDTLEDLDPSLFPINKPTKTNKSNDETLRQDSSSNKEKENSKTEFKVFYDKKSFYDNLSHEKKLSKSDLKEEHMKQREIDIATFGRMSIRNWHSRNHSFRGRKHNNSNQFNVKAGWERRDPTHNRNSENL
uniref:Scd6-like Sm domain containing protein, putative n=1 Tax=Theileria annulata TaxID=5874 RepID=A0A3B0MPU4_THEAN